MNLLDIFFKNFNKFFTNIYIGELNWFLGVSFFKTDNFIAKSTWFMSLICICKTLMIQFGSHDAISSVNASKSA